MEKVGHRGPDPEAYTSLRPPPLSLLPILHDVISFSSTTSFSHAVSALEPADHGLNLIKMGKVKPLFLYSVSVCIVSSNKKANAVIFGIVIIYKHLCVKQYRNTGRGAHKVIHGCIKQIQIMARVEYFMVTKMMDVRI